jgi:hypothetical protein
VPAKRLPHHLLPLCAVSVPPGHGLSFSKSRVHTRPAAAQAARGCGCRLVVQALMLALIQTRWQMRMLAGAPRVLVTLKVFLVTLHNETTKHTWRESARVYKKRNFHNGGAQGPPVEAHVAWSGSLPRPGHVRFKRHPAAQRRCRRSRKTHATFGFGFGVCSWRRAYRGGRDTRGTSSPRVAAHAGDCRRCRQHV